MLEYLKKMLAENGDVSSTRVAMILCVLAACTIGIAALFRDKDLAQVAILVGAFLAPAFAAKVMQKKSEGEDAGPK